MNYVKALRDGEITERGLQEELNLKTFAELLDIIFRLEGADAKLKGPMLDRVTVRNRAQAAIIKAAKRKEP